LRGKAGHVRTIPINVRHSSYEARILVCR
jgi:hypothetical protein